MILNVFTINELLYSLQLLEPFKASSNILGSCLEVLQLCDPVALSGCVQVPDGEWSPDALGHFSQKGLHSGHLSLVHHKPASAVKWISIPVHHHTLHWRQDSCGAGSHLGASCYSHRHSLKTHNSVQIHTFSPLTIFMTQIH